MRAGLLVDGRFEIERLAGVGGMGSVYRACDRLDGRPVALKVMHSTVAERDARFAREAAVLGRLRHPGIVRYVAHGWTDDGEPYLAMDWLEGETLDVRLVRERLTVAESLAIVLQAAEALGAAHRLGIVHRDVKPSNVFLIEDQVRLLDFGIARASATSALTHTGARIGTPA